MNSVIGGHFVKALKIAFLFALISTSTSFAAYQTRGFHKSCLHHHPLLYTVSSKAAKARAESKADHEAAAAARKKCSDVALRIDNLDVKTICKDPFMAIKGRAILNAVCVECSAEATFDCR
jgi:hypothetical protein